MNEGVFKTQRNRQSKLLKESVQNTGELDQ